MTPSPGATSATADPVLQAVVQAAVDATGAAHGWLLARGADGLAVVAAAGSEPGRLLGATVPVDSGTAGYVVGSGQPVAMAPRPGDDRFEGGVAALLGHQPSSVLCVPCGDDDTVHGALELVDKHGGGTFTFDDVELASLLAGVAGVALGEGGRGDVGSVPAPAQLGSELADLATADPGRYATIAPVVAALLANG